ncbi:MAG: DNA polymerase III subunit delta [Endomicrobium sp.]|nr:DNA polymerase III subunit delta [Endomicrobium sp.]
MLTFQEFSESLKQNNVIYPIYIFVGEESYLINLGLNKLEQVISVDYVNRETFYLQYTSIIYILSSIQTYPFYGKLREIIVKDIDKMTTKESEHLIMYLGYLVDNSTNISCLILIYPTNYKNDTNIKRQEFIYKCISSKRCMVVNCRTLLHHELIQFIKNEFTTRNKIISNEILYLISTKLGTNLASIVSEIEKLTLCMDNQTTSITNNHCYKTLQHTYNTKLISLYSAIIKKNMSVAFSTVNQLFIDNQEPIVILHIIASSLRKIINAKSMLEEQNISKLKIAKILKVRQDSITSFFKNVQKHNLEQLKNSFKILLKLDIGIKSAYDFSYIRTLIDEIIIFICQ